jgi:methylglyoxal synthase/RimJ/RimL family protein N-acetyltransferase
MEPATGRLAHFPEDFGGAEQRGYFGGAEQRGYSGGAEQRGYSGGAEQRGYSGGAEQRGYSGGAVIAEPSSKVAGVQPPARRPALALTAEGPRRADLIAWAGAHSRVLEGMRLLAPAGIKALLHEHVGLDAEILKSGTIGPAATAGLAAAGEIDAMVAFSDPIELRPGDNTTRSLTRLAVFWDIPIAGNRATADLLLTTVTAANALPADLAEGPPNEPEPVRGTVKLWTVRATVEDVPGRLAVLAASLARRAINILSVQVHLTPDGPVDELLVAASPVLLAGDLTAAIVDGGARSPRVAPADPHALVDAPTRALALATRLVRNPGDVAQVLLSLLPGAQITWRAEPPEDHADSSRQLWLDDPTGGGFLLTRDAAPFTPAESARAYAMMDVATVALPREVTSGADDESWRLLLADGTEMTVRRAALSDEQAVLNLHERCSLMSRLRRYLAGIRHPAPVTLAALLSRDAGYCLVVEDPDGRIVAMANLARDGDSPEIAVLVEDVWQGRRIGTTLVRRLIDEAQRTGVQSVRSVVHARNTQMVRIMTALGQRLHREYEGGMLTLIATLAGTARAKSTGSPAASA